MENNTSRVSIGINFSLIRTQFHAMCEKNEGGYTILLIPPEQAPDSGISVEDLIDDIKKMARGATGNDTAVGTTQLEKATTEAAKGGGPTSMRLEDTVIKPQMTHLCICGKEENSVLEYAFQLRVVTKGLVPGTIKPIVDVMNLPISARNTDRREVVDKMALITMDECLDAATLPDKSQAAKQHRKRNIQRIMERLRGRNGRNEPEADVMQHSCEGCH